MISTDFSKIGMRFGCGQYGHCPWSMGTRRPGAVILGGCTGAIRLAGRCEQTDVSSKAGLDLVLLETEGHLVFVLEVD